MTGMKKALEETAALGPDAPVSRAIEIAERALAEQKPQGLPATSGYDPMYGVVDTPEEWMK